MSKFLFFPEDLTYEASSFNVDADADAGSSNADDDPIEWSESSRKPLLFRGGFFRFLKRDGVTVRVECLNCKAGNVYSGHTRSNSNLLKHLSVSCSSKLSPIQLLISNKHALLFSECTQRLMSVFWRWERKKSRPWIKNGSNINYNRWPNLNKTISIVSFWTSWSVGCIIRNCLKTPHLTPYWMVTDLPQWNGIFSEQ